MTTIDPTAVEEQPTAARQMTLPELRKFEGQLFIQNNSVKHITFHEKLGDKSVDFELEPMGDPLSPNPDSIAFLPKLALDMRGLQKLWMRGEVTISTDPDMEDRIMLLNAKAIGVAEDRMQKLLGQQTESNTSRDITEALCLVCGKRNPQTEVVERGRVLQSRRDVKEGIPPLCAEHLGEAHKFVPRLVSEKGEEHWEFDSVHLGVTQR